MVVQCVYMLNKHRNLHGPSFVLKIRAYKQDTLKFIGLWSDIFYSVLSLVAPFVFGMSRVVQEESRSRSLAQQLESCIP